MLFLYVISVITFIVFYYCTRTFNYWTNKNVAGPKPVPIFGNIMQSVLRRKHVGIIYKEIYDEYPKEKVIGIYRMTSPTLIIRDLDVVKSILIKDFDAFPDRGIIFSKTGLGDNLFHCELDTWRYLRNKFTQLFTSGKLKNLMNLMNEHGDLFLEYLENKALNNHEQELHQHFQKFTISTIIASSFGLNVDLFNEDDGIAEKAGYYAFKSTYAAETDMLFPGILKKLNRSLYNSVVNKFCYKVMKMATQQTDEVPPERYNAIDLMLALRKKDEVGAIQGSEDNKDVYLKMTDHVMAGQVFVLFIAGFGNNALTLSYTFFYLAKYPEIQRKLINEIDEVLVRHNGKLTYEAIKEMTYLDQVFSETVRMNPLANSVQRQAARTYTIPGTDVVIDKGTIIVISPYAIQRDEKNYPNPDVFNPERFSPENSRDRHPCAFIPFGAGPRSCIGRQLAKLQYAAGIVKVLSKFTVKPSDKTPNIENYDPMRTLIATKGGVYVNLVARK